MLKWTVDEKGERYPDYTPEQAQRIARAAWGVHYLLPHPDDVRDKEHAANIIRFNRAIIAAPPTKED